MYAPILRSKESELVACSKLKPMTPLRPIVRFTAQDRDEKEAVKLVDHLNRWVEIGQHIGQPITLLVDDWTVGLVRVALNELKPSARLSLAFPLLQREQYWDDAIDVHDNMGEGFTVFLNSDDTRDASMLEWVVAKQAEIDLRCIFRLRLAPGTRAGELADYARICANRLVDAGVANIGFAAGSYPIDNSLMLSSSINQRPRMEWIAFKQVASELQASLDFCDFGPMSPDAKEVKLNIPEFTPAVRYTCEDHWKICRGKKAPRGAFKEQSADLVSKIVDDEAVFYGREFSWGDERLKLIAMGVIDPPGSFGGLKKLEINHHLTLTAAQLAHLASPGAQPLVPQATGDN